jgi:hypothetical protein
MDITIIAGIIIAVIIAAMVAALGLFVYKKKQTPKQ